MEKKPVKTDKWCQKHNQAKVNYTLLPGWVCLACIHERGSNHEKVNWSKYWVVK